MAWALTSVDSRCEIMTTVRPTATPVALACTVQTNDLNMRSGPGVVYDPPLRKLSAGTPLRALARSTAADWIQVEVLPARTPGWLATRFVNCIGNVQSLPVGQIPPTPQPTQPPGEARPAHYVSTTATGSGDGSLNAPWTLQQALSQPASLKPGDVVWLRGGTYTGTHITDPSLGRISFSCGTHGTATDPIVFRNHNDERVTIDGEGNQVALFVQNCSHTWFWGLEVMSSAPVRTPSRSYIYCTAPDVKFINMILQPFEGLLQTSGHAVESFRQSADFIFAFNISPP